MTDHAQIDLRFGGRDGAICCHRIDDVIVDPGPGACIDVLLQALGGLEPRAILVTHPHLDHAGAVGALARRWPNTRVWVHENGVDDLVDPSRLQAGADFIYGPATGAILGAAEPVPREQLVVLSDAETRDGFVIRHTPGHANHHVCFLHEDSGLALAGDMASTKIGAGPLLPATPPPDFDLELWLASLELIRDWKPQAIAVTHFGTFADVDSHLDEMIESLRHWSSRAAVTDGDEYLAEILRASGDPDTYSHALPLASLHAGIAGYLQRREG